MDDPAPEDRMIARFHVIEKSFRRTDRRRRWLGILQHTATLGGILALLFAWLGGAVYAAWIKTPAVAWAFVAVLLAGGAATWLILLMVVVSRNVERPWLAQVLERTRPELLDRLNTLVFLEKNRRQPGAESFYPRIAAQTQKVLATADVRGAVPGRRAWLRTLVCLGLIGITTFCYIRFTPWQRMRAAYEARAAEQQAHSAPPPAPSDLPTPEASLAEEKQVWGEVRITQPARDLKVTKVDVVPLQIEAAANQPLQEVSWLQTINGSEEVRHALPPPQEPRYAVYQPELYLDELKLSDWDLLTYYAKAKAEGANGFASDVYFLEVRPFREDILKMPGGEGGSAYQCLSELSSLIEQQQHIIRQTHQHVQSPPPLAHLEVQDRQKLAEAETDLSATVKHLYAKMASEMENKPIGAALDQLAKAEGDLSQASQALREPDLPQAQSQERLGLADLVAARKIFQKAVSEHPEDFEEPKLDEPPAATDTQLQAIAEFRNEAKAAKEFVDNAVKKQQDVSRRATTTAKTKARELSAEEKQLQKTLSDFQSQHPKAFPASAEELAAATNALAKAAQSLQAKSPSARADTQQAVEELQKLQNSVQKKSADQQLTDAYKLKQVLDEKIKSFGQCQQAPGGVSSSDLRQSVAQTRETLKQLKSAAESEPTRSAFGQPLREALSDMSMKSLQRPLSKVEQAADETARGEAAGQAKDALQKVSKAFDQSQPQAMQSAQLDDALKADAHESLDLGLSQLESLLRQLQDKRSVDSKQQAKQGREALFNLQNAFQESEGSNERGQAVVALLQDELTKTDTPFDPVQIQKLMEQLKRFSVETPDHLAKKTDPPEVGNIDPARLPPAYRSRIEKYFQKLSER